jgi:hypothetical protein
MPSTVSGAATQPAGAQNKIYGNMNLNSDMQQWFLFAKPL